MISNLLTCSDSILIIVDDTVNTVTGKTAHGLIREYNDTHKICIISKSDDTPSEFTGSKIGIDTSITILNSVHQAVKEFGEFGCAVVGVAPHGGKMTNDILELCIDSLANGIDVVNTLHDLLENNTTARSVASLKGSKIYDVRKPKATNELRRWSGEVQKVKTPRLAVLGTDCNVGKRTTAILLAKELNRREIDTQFISTGQTGKLIGGGHGFVLDATLNDFTSGEIESCVLACDKEHSPNLMVIGGQSSLLNPNGPNGLEILLSSQSKHVVLQHIPSRKYFDGFDSGDLIDVQREKQIIELLGAEVVCITLNTIGLSTTQAELEQRRLSGLLQCPVHLPLTEIDSVANAVVSSITSLATSNSRTRHLEDSV